MNADVLTRVSLHDHVFQLDNAVEYSPSYDHEIHRPKTADLEPEVDPQDRPFTSASFAKPIPEPNSADSAKMTPRGGLRDSITTGSTVEVALASNWGDPSYMGLTSIALLEADSRQPIALRPDQITLSLPAMEGVGTNFEVAKLIDEVHLTTDAAHMWACPVPHPSHSSSSSQCPSLTFTLDTPTSLGGLRVWNYNASMEDSYKGVRYYTYVTDMIFFSHFRWFRSIL